MSRDEEMVLTRYRKLKEIGHGGLELEVKDKVLTKLWVTDKVDLSDVRGERVRGI